MLDNFSLYAMIHCYNWFSVLIVMKRTMTMEISNIPIDLRIKKSSAAEMIRERIGKSLTVDYFFFENEPWIRWRFHFFQSSLSWRDDGEGRDNRIVDRRFMDYVADRKIEIHTKMIQAGRLDVMERWIGVTDGRSWMKGCCRWGTCDNLHRYTEKPRFRNCFFRNPRSR